MYEALLVVFLIVAIGLVGLVMLQQGKGADMGASFGAGASGTLFGSSGSGNFMTRMTGILAALFFIISAIGVVISFIPLYISSYVFNLRVPEVSLATENIADFISAYVIGNLLQQPVKALILLTYGVGNAPQDERLLSQLRTASQRGVIIVNLSQCLRGKVNMGGYATGNALAQAGVISGSDMTVEATLTKLHYLLSQGLDTETIRQAMQQNLRGELTPDE